MMKLRRNRAGERGQVLVLTGVMSLVIIGAVALAVDLTQHTFNQRSLQNVSDAAALAGATDLGATPTSTQQKAGITDALATIKQNQGFPSTWTTGFSASACGSGYCETVTYQSYTVKLSTPPQSARSSNNGGVNDFEAEIYLNVNNNIGAVLGAPTAVVGAHSVAYHSGPPAPYPYTFFSASHVGSGNQAESIYGNAYVGNGYSPQSSGKAGLCVYEIAGPEPSSDADGDAGTTADNDSDDQGYAVFGSVPPSVGSDPVYGQSGSCAGGGQFSVQQPQPQTASPTNSPAGAPPTYDSSGGEYLCLLSSPTVPSITQPVTNQSALCGAGGSATVDNTTAAGVYPVGAGCTVTLDFSGGNINCVDLVLGTGASVSVSNKKGQQFMSSYAFNPSGDTVADNDITALGQSVPSSACPGASSDNGTQSYNCVICASPTTTTPMPTALSNGTTGCCSDALFIGSVFLPGQAVSFATNQAMEVAGSVYCGDWSVQSGNHPNPVVSRDAADTVYLAETLRLAE